MTRIAALDAGLYRIPLPTVLTDSTHGEMTAFQLITVRLLDGDGAEGVGYTFTVGMGGAAVHALVERDLKPILLGRDPSRIEALWRDMWWHLHYGGRGGQTSLAISAVDMALWDLSAKRAGKPLWRLLGGFDAKVPAYAGGIDLDISADELQKMLMRETANSAEEAARRLLNLVNLRGATDNATIVVIRAS